MKHLENIFADIKTIGSDIQSQWREAPASFTEDKLEILGHPVMEEWERPYMQELARIAASKGGRVLEIGFGMAISATYLHQYPLEEHLIIEANKDVFEKINSFAQTVPHKVTPLLGFWQDLMPTLPDNSIDGILFDPYPMNAEDFSLLILAIAFFPHAYRVLKPGGVLTYYSAEYETFSPQHQAALIETGFTQISGTIVPVDTPPDCRYWKHPTFLAPIIVK